MNLIVIDIIEGFGLPILKQQDQLSRYGLYFSTMSKRGNLLPPTIFISTFVFPSLVSMIL
jgi:hypothetical protein